MKTKKCKHKYRYFHISSQITRFTIKGIETENIALPKGAKCLDCGKILKPKSK